MEAGIILTYIHPELVILVFVLYFIGMALKKTVIIKDELIPIILGAISILVCALYVFSIHGTVTGYSEVCAWLFDIIIQGILCAAGSVYVNQIYKQTKKLRDTSDTENSQ